MILGFHITISCYGHWQPNDPRGSGSRYVGSKKLFAIGGKATKTDSRRSVAHVPHDVCLRLRIKEALKYPPILFSERQIETVGTAFGTLLQEKNISTFACTVVRDHVHLLIGQTDIHVDELILALKETAVAALLRNNLHPRSALPGYTGPLTVAASVWAVGGWKVFVDNPERMYATIRYIENHSYSQRWSFIEPFI
jgi:REP element-mobilizing transposase RayT